MEPPTQPLGYGRVLLKLSGETLGGGKVGIDLDVVADIARQVAQVARRGIQIAIVVGGGNFFRGAELSQRGMERGRADYMGMLGTVMNCLALQDFCEKAGVATRVQTAITMGQVAEPYIPLRAIRHLEKGRVVILAGGLGSPFFTTDTPAALRAAEIEAEAVLKGTHSGVDGVYTADPRLEPGATKLDEVTYMEVINQGLNVMDPTSITFCMDNALPIVVFDALVPGNLRRVLEGEDRVGTLVR